MQRWKCASFSPSFQNTLHCHFPDPFDRRQAEANGWPGGYGLLSLRLSRRRLPGFDLLRRRRGGARLEQIGLREDKGVFL